MHMTISLLLKPIIGLCNLFCHPYIESTIASIIILQVQVLRTMFHHLCRNPDALPYEVKVMATYLIQGM